MFLGATAAQRLHTNKQKRQRVAACTPINIDSLGARSMSFRHFDTRDTFSRDSILLLVLALLLKRGKALIFFDFFRSIFFRFFFHWRISRIFFSFGSLFVRWFSHRRRRRDEGNERERASEEMVTSEQWRKRTKEKRAKLLCSSFHW